MSDDKRRYSRRLSIAENELWRAVTADVRPFRAPIRAPAVQAGGREAAAPAVLPRSAAVRHPSSAAPKQAAPLRDIDHRTLTKIRRGRLEVDAKLDLHGMRQAEAQSALFGFLRRAQAEGDKLVIVVTGKGLTRDDSGVLRRMVPLWLQAASLRDVVVGFGEASRHHGGEGALYIRVRRAGRSHS